MTGFMVLLGILFWIAGAVFGLDGMSAMAQAKYVTHQMVGINSMMLAILCGGFGGLFFGIAGIIEAVTPPRTGAQDAAPGAIAHRSPYQTR